MTGGLAVPHLAPISREALAVWGVDAAGEASIRAVCDSFVRASPTNLMLSGMLRRILNGEQPGGSGTADTGWTPPPPLPALPPLADVTALGAAERGVLMSLGTEVGGQPFVPGLYRMLAQWPAFPAHVATVLRPHFGDAATRASGAKLLAAIDAEIPAVFASLPPPALDAYRKTSPEMVVFSLMIRSALPAS